jgi:hypothetical protein
MNVYSHLEFHKVFCTKHSGYLRRCRVGCGKGAGKIENVKRKTFHSLRFYNECIGLHLWVHYVLQNLYEKEEEKEGVK